MFVSWIVWVVSGLVFFGAIQLLRQMPGGRDFRERAGGRDFREVAGGLAILGLGTGALREDFRWHLLWYTPVAIILAYLYALRGMFALRRRIDKIVEGAIAHPEEFSSAAEHEVFENSRSAPDSRILDTTSSAEFTDPRSRAFMRLTEIERSFSGLSPQEKRDARIAYVADLMSRYDDESQWKRHLRPPYFVWCLVPLVWPILWYRGAMSKMALSALSGVIDDCRSLWSDDLHESGLRFDQYHDPLSQSEIL